MKNHSLLFLLLLVGFNSYGQIFSMEDIRNQAAQPDAPLRIELQQRLLTELKLSIDLFATTQDPEAIILQQAFIPIIMDHPESMELKIHYQADERAGGVFISEDGAEDILEARRQLAIKDLYPEKYLDYLLIRGDDLSQEYWSVVTDSLGFDTLQINQLAQSQAIEEVFRKNIERGLPPSFPSIQTADFPSKISINEELYNISPNDLFLSNECCSYSNCIASCWANETSGTAASQLSVILDVIRIVATCSGCYSNRRFDLDKCTDCVGEIAGVSEEALEQLFVCMETCLADPCAGSGANQCDPGKYCHKWDIVENYRPFQINTVGYRECVNCPRTTQLNHHELEISLVEPTNSYESGLLRTIVETHPYYNYIFRKKELNGSITEYIGEADKDRVFDIYDFDPVVGNEFCIAYQGLYDMEACGIVEGPCISIDCPDYDISLTSGNDLKIDITGVHNFMSAEYWVDKKDGQTNEISTIVPLETKNSDLFTTYSTVYNNLGLKAGDCIMVYASIDYLHTPVDDQDCFDAPFELCFDECDFTPNRVSIKSVEIVPEDKAGVFNGKLTIEAQGGTKPYTYNWSNNKTDVPSIINLRGDATYCVTITDNKGCFAETCRKVPVRNNCLDGGNIIETGGEPDNDLTTNTECFTLTHTKSDESMPQANDGSISVNADGGTPPYLYYWEDMYEVKYSGDRSDLSPGEYCLNVYDQECCLESICITIEDACNNESFQIPNPDIQNPRGCNATNGSIGYLTAIQFPGPSYSYAWSNGETGSAIGGLSAGTYTVTITDLETRCELVQSFNLVAVNYMTLSHTVSPAEYPLCNGNIELSINNGTPPFSVLVFGNNNLVNTGGNNSAYTFDGLCGGNYTVSVRDANGCERVFTAFVNDCFPPDIPEAQITAASDCDGGDGAITLQDAPSDWTYTWSSGTTGPSATGLDAGTYTLTVTDDEGCTNTMDYSVGVNSPGGRIWEINAIIVEHDEDNDCQGSIFVSVNYNGSPDMRFVLIADGFEQEHVMTGPPYKHTFTNLCAATYELQIIEGLPLPWLECTISRTITIEACSEFRFVTKPEITMPDNCNASNGSIIYSYPPKPVAGVTGALRWNWSTGDDQRYQLTDLSPGIYSLTISNHEGCTLTQTFDLTVPSDIDVVNFSNIVQPTDGCDGSITVDGIAGIELTLEGPGGPYSTTMTGNTHTFSSLCLGTYTLNFVDINGCEGTLTTVLSQCAPLQLGIEKVIEPTTCNSSDGQINFRGSISGGTSPYTMELFDENGNLVPRSVSASWLNLSAGEYRLLVTDAEGCILEKTYTFIGQATPEILWVEFEPECEGEANGIIAFATWNESGGDFRYELSKDGVGLIRTEISDVLIEFENLETGVYSLVVTHIESGCTTSGSGYFLEEIPSTGPFGFVDANTSSSPSCKFQFTGQIQVGATGGNPPYGVRLNGEPLGLMDDILAITNLQAGTYQVEIIDRCSRLRTREIVVEEYPAMEISGNVTFRCDNNSSIDLTVSGGTGPFSYNWSNGETTQDLGQLGGGTYQVTVTDGNGCFQSSEEFTVDEEVAPEVSFETTSICEYRNGMWFGPIYFGAIEATVSSGVPPFEYTWKFKNDEVTDNDNDGRTLGRLLEPGEYTLEITDKCDKIHTYEVTLGASLIDADQEPQSTDCYYSFIECGDRIITELYSGLVGPESPLKGGPNNGKWIEIYDDCTYELYCKKGGIASGTFGQGEEQEPIYQGSYDPVTNTATCERVIYCRAEVNTVDPMYNYPVEGVAFKELSRDDASGELQWKSYTSAQSGFMSCDFSHNMNPEKLHVLFCNDIPIYEECRSACEDGYVYTENEDECRIERSCPDDPNTVEYQSKKVECFVHYGARYAKLEICTLDPDNPTHIQTFVDLYDDIDHEDLCCVKYQYNCQNIAIALIGTGGAVDRSSEEETTEPVAKKLESWVQPNPFSHTTDLNIQYEDYGQVSVRIYNLVGKGFVSKQIPVAPGLNTITLDVENSLAAGIYLLEVTDNNGNRAVHRIVKL
ncbi:MAG: T9SS type A sorting domain-containing protein [Bacteroidota bacterium]